MLTEQQHPEEQRPDDTIAHGGPRKQDTKIGSGRNPLEEHYRTRKKGSGQDDHQGKDREPTERAPTDCEREGIVGGDEGPVDGVAQVVCHRVKVVGVHGEEGQEKNGEVRREVKGEVDQLRDNRTCAWREGGMTDSRDLSKCGV